MSTQTITPKLRTAEQFADQVLQAASTTLDLFAMYIGDRLGFYEVLAQDGPLSARELARRTGTHERYVREWLEHQAVAGIVELEEDGASPESNPRFVLPPDRAEVLADRDSLNYLAPALQLAAGAVQPLDKVLRAYREGGGVCYHEYGTDLWEGQGRMNRVPFLQLLGHSWIPTMKDVHQRLTTGEQPLVADFGCGVGWSSIGVAQAYPRVHVHGFDLDEPSILRAKENAAEAGVSDRVRFEVRDAGDPELHGRYDLVMAFECVHDMSDPVAALWTMRRLVREDGTVFVMDERTADRFTPEAGFMEKFLYGCSVLHCLPVGMAEQPAAGTGTVMREQTFRRYAEQAGFSGVQVLPIDHPMFRFYRLITGGTNGSQP